MEPFERAKALIDSAAKMPEKLVTVADAEKAADFVNQINACLKKLADEMKDRRAPHLEAVRDISDVYGLSIGRLDEIKKTVVAMQTAYLENANVSEARSEYNSLTILRETEGLEIDHTIIDLNLLKEFIDWDAVKRAAKKSVKAGKRIDGIITVTTRKAVTR